MRGIIFIIVVMLLSGMTTQAQKINPEKPDLSPANFHLDSLPSSEINIPIQVNLKPFYAMAEKSVDTLFTSPNYPDGWVQDGCDTRFKYSFRRSPLTMKASGLSVSLGFMGYYKIVGSTRVCVSGTVLSPWTPACRCGFDEPERRVNVSFTSSMNIQPDYKLKVNITRNEPQALDKCEVCFWGQDITKQVLKGLTAELDASAAGLNKQYGLVDLRPRFQQIWDKLNKTYNVYGLGWLSMHPQQLRINNIYTLKDSLNIYLGLSAKPVISFEKPAEKMTAVPNISNFSRRSGFSIFLDAVMSYDSLSRIVNQQIGGTSFDFRKGFVKKKFIIDSCKIYGAGSEMLVIKINFSGTNSGIVYMLGKPVYKADTRTLEVENVDFDIKSKNLLLGAADWLFDKKITKEITKNARFELGGYIDSAKVNINKQLNQEWVKGIRSTGNITDIKLAGIYPMPGNLIIRSNCEGTLAVKVDAIPLSL